MLKSSLVAITLFASLALGTSAFAACNNAHTGAETQRTGLANVARSPVIDSTAFAAWVGFHVAADEGEGNGGEDVEVIGYGSELSIICKDENVSETTDIEPLDLNGDNLPDKVWIVR